MTNKTIHAYGARVLGSDYMEIPYGAEAERGNPAAEGVQAAVRVSAETGLLEFWSQAAGEWSTTNPAASIEQVNLGVMTTDSDILPSKIYSVAGPTGERVLKFKASDFKPGDSAYVFTVDSFAVGLGSSLKFADGDSNFNVILGTRLTDIAVDSPFSSLRHIRTANTLYRVTYVGDGTDFNFIIDVVRKDGLQSYRGDLNTRLGDVTITATKPENYELKAGYMYTFLAHDPTSYPSEFSIENTAIIDGDKIWINVESNEGLSCTAKWNSAAQASNFMLKQFDGRVVHTAAGITEYEYRNGQWQRNGVVGGTLFSGPIGRDSSALTDNDLSNFSPGTSFHEELNMGSCFGIDMVIDGRYSATSVPLVSMKVSTEINGYHLVTVESEGLEGKLTRWHEKSDVVWSRQFRYSEPVSRTWVSGYPIAARRLAASPKTTFVLDIDEDVQIFSAYDLDTSAWREGDIVELINLSSAGNIIFNSGENAQDIVILDKDGEAVDQTVSSDLTVPARGAVRYRYGKRDGQANPCWSFLEAVYY